MALPANSVIKLGGTTACTPSKIDTCVTASRPPRFPSRSSDVTCRGTACGPAAGAVRYRLLDSLAGPHPVGGGPLSAVRNRRGPQGLRHTVLIVRFGRP